MFTGIVHELGTVMDKRAGSDRAELKIEVNKINRPVLGESIAVNGVCLTVREAGERWFVADVMPATWRSTNLSLLKPGDPVNIEPALRVGDSLGGHFVSGHVDGVGRIAAVVRERNAVLFKISAARELIGMMAVKGSVAVDGVSLTVQELGEDVFQVSLIPHTFSQTRFHRLRPGDIVNIETDLLMKTGKQNGDRGRGKGLTMEFLKANGFV